MIRNDYSRFSARSAALLLAFVLAVHAAGATTFARMSLEQMSRSAALVVRARCLSNSTGWDAGEIWTFTSFAIEETWMGTAPDHIVVRLLGGRAGNVTSSVTGIPRFRIGEDVVLFLERTPRGDFSVTSWQQGTFRLRRDIRTGEEMATQDTASFPVFDGAAHQFVTCGIRNLPLDLLRARVSIAVHAVTERPR